MMRVSQYEKRSQSIKDLAFFPMLFTNVERNDGLFIPSLSLAMKVIIFK